METMELIYREANSVFENMLKGSDKRMDEFPLMSNWFHTLAIIVGYILMIKFGKLIMKNRKAYDARNAMVIYNMFMVGLSTVLVLLILFHYWIDGGSLTSCWIVDYSEKGYPFTSAFIGWLFYFTKLIELTDTVFFVVRKKFHLLTFLHVFHHAMMPLSVWFGIKFAPGGSNAFYPLINSAVHIAMYLYYGIAAMGPKYAKYIWWKKYMTQIQMFQFLLLIIHSSILLSTPCDFPKIFTFVILIYATIFFFLFLNYYIKAYKKEQ